jgi:hypothetical protein
VTATKKQGREPPRGHAGAGPDHRPQQHDRQLHRRRCRLRRGTGRAAKAAAAVGDEDRRRSRSTRTARARPASPSPRWAPARRAR